MLPTSGKMTPRSLFRMNVQSKSASKRDLCVTNIPKPTVRKREKLSLPFHNPRQFNNTIHPYTLPTNFRTQFRFLDHREADPDRQVLHPIDARVFPICVIAALPHIPIGVDYMSHLSGFCMLPSDRSRQGRMGGHTCVTPKNEWST